MTYLGKGWRLAATSVPFPSVVPSNITGQVPLNGRGKIFADTVKYIRLGFYALWGAEVNIYICAKYRKY